MQNVHRTGPSVLLSCVLAATLAPIVICNTAAAEIGDSGLGLCVHLPANDLIDMSQDSGVTWIRVDGNWEFMNPSEGTWTWAEMDRVVTEAHDRGLNVFMSLGYTPAWVPRVDRARTDSYDGNDEPLTSTEWVAFVEAAVEHYAAMGVTHFGIWNEPNLDGFWEEAAGVGSWIDKILLPGADAVRSACPSCLVLGPELANVGECDIFLDDVLTDAVDAFDIITHHIYQDWAETGHNVWDGDSFLNALEDRRFFFTRASLREVLDRHGFSGEVWITETGYQARIDDAADEDLQAVYVRRVMEEQLARPWWTNSFFYEITDCGIDQPACPIDGFGVTRPVCPTSTCGPRSFPDDYRLKPAYLEIRGFIDDHPEIIMESPPAQCADNDDNDGDGRVDADDRGCSDGLDDDEADDPPRRALEAIRVETSISIDGDLADWTPDGWTTLGESEWFGVLAHGGMDDASVSAAARWEPGRLFLAIDVTDDEHFNDHAAPDLWLGDSLQLGFDIERDLGDEYDDDNDHEINVGLTSGVATGYRFHGPESADDSWELAVVRDGTSTRYEIALPASVLAPATLEDGDVFGFSFLVNDNDGFVTIDGTGREGWLEFTSGIGSGKEPYQFGELSLVTEPTDPDGDADADGDGDGDGDSDGDGDGDSDGDGDGDSDGDGDGDSDGDGDGDSDGDGDGDSDGDGDGGCECRTAHGDGPTPSSALLAFVTLILFVRSRRVR